MTSRSGHRFRVGVLHIKFFDLCEQATAGLLLVQDEIKRFTAGKGSPTDEAAWASWREALQEPEKRADDCAVSAIVFSGMALESAAYDFAAHFLGDDYVSSVLDKLDATAKWLVYPKLTHGQSIDPAGRAYGWIKKTVQKRNSLVHAKSEPGRNYIDPKTHELSFDRIQKLEDENRELQQVAFDSYRALLALAWELSAFVDPGDVPFSYILQNGVGWEPPAPLEATVRDIKTRYRGTRE